MLVSDFIKFRDDILARAESIPLSKAIDDSCVELECIISSNPAISETNMHEKIKWIPATATWIQEPQVREKSKKISKYVS